MLLLLLSLECLPSLHIPFVTDYIPSVVLTIHNNKDNNYGLSSPSLYRALHTHLKYASLFLDMYIYVLFPHQPPREGDRARDFPKITPTEALRREHCLGHTGGRERRVTESKETLFSPKLMSRFERTFCVTLETLFPP